ncbi:hypothetical protein PMIN04_005489 [Paraphaeosphaeria minitans]
MSRLDPEGAPVVTASSALEGKAVDHVPASTCRSGRRAAVRGSHVLFLRAHTETDHGLVTETKRCRWLRSQVTTVNDDAASPVAAVRTPVAPSLSGSQHLTNGVRDRPELAFRYHLLSALYLG